MYVREYMSTEVLTLTRDTPIHVAQRQMRDNRIHHSPVVDEKGRLIGLLTDRKLKEVIALFASSLNAGTLQEPLLNVKAEDVMVKKVITISPDAPLAEAGALGVKHRIGALPVVNRDGEMVGIITTTDLVKALIQILRLSEPGVLLDFALDSGPVNLPEIIEIIYKHRAKIKALFCTYPPQVKREDLVIHIDVDDVDPINEELKARGYSCTIARHGKY